MHEPHEEVRREMSRHAGPGRGMRAQTRVRKPLEEQSAVPLRAALIFGTAVLLAVGICLWLGN